jgi:maltose O-acetyltransferase
MAAFRKVIRESLWLLSEVEAIFSQPNSPIWTRRFYLKYCGTKFITPLWIGRSIRLINGNNLILGKRCALGDYVRIIAWTPITIGDDFTGASGLHIDSGSHNTVDMSPQGAPIKIGNRVWCGINVTIIAGVTIGDDVVIGAGSVVCNDIPPGNIVSGVPARVIKSLNRGNIKIWTWVSGHKQ